MRVKDVNFSVIFALLRSASRSVCHGLKVFFEVFDATTAKTFLGAARPLSTSSTLTTTLVPTSTSGNFDWENESIFFACCSWPNLPHSLSLYTDTILPFTELANGMLPKPSLISSLSPKITWTYWWHPEHLWAPEVSFSQITQ